MKNLLRSLVLKYGSDLVVSVATLSALALFALAMAISQPYFEARQYEQMTGKRATYWDAFWLDLRVVSEANDEVPR